jgi:hypothetical protein
MLTGIECANGQFSWVHLGPSTCKYVQLVPRRPSKMRYGPATSSLGCHSWVVNWPPAVRADAGPGDAVNVLLDRVNRNGVRFPFAEPNISDRTLLAFW